MTYNGASFSDIAPRVDALKAAIKEGLDHAVTAG